MVANVGTLVGMIKQVQSTTLQTGTTTDGVPEGSSNLYFTASRGRSVISASSPLSYSNTTGIVSIPKANSTTNGYLSHTDWNTFNNKANSFSGYSGSITVVTDIDFVNSTKTTSTLNFSNGVLTSIT